MEEIIKWLMEGPSYTRYRTQIDLLERSENDPLVINCRNEMLRDQKISSLVEECGKWPGPVLKRHNDAKLLIHKLAFLSELGLNRNDDHIPNIAELVMKDQDELGPFRVLTHLYERFGGSGNDESAWFLCDAPTVVYSLAKLGYKRDNRVLKARDHLISLVEDNGWRCRVSIELGDMKGPGSRRSECPYATLLMLKMISEFKDLKNSDEANAGISTILNLWTDRRERKPFLFAMGTDFKKLKAPLVWYDILHVVEVLSRFPQTLNDERFLEMISIIKDRSDQMGRYTPGSVWMAWKGWDFSQKKEPSPWITYRVLKIMKKIH